MQFLFKTGGWFFLIVGSIMVFANIDSVEHFFTNSKTGNSYWGLVPLILGMGQVLLGLIFVRISKFMGKDGLASGLIDKQKLEQRIVEMEAKGKDTSRMRMMMEKIDQANKKQNLDSEKD